MDTKFDFKQNQKFDFEQIGKRMPYSTPENFFSEMEANVMKTVEKKHTMPIGVVKKKRPILKTLWIATLSVAASIAAICIFNTDISSPRNDMQEVEMAFAQLSASDQDYILGIYQEDVFLDNIE